MLYGVKLKTNPKENKIISTEVRKSAKIIEPGIKPGTSRFVGYRLHYPGMSMLINLYQINMFYFLHPTTEI